MSAEMKGVFEYIRLLERQKMVLLNILANMEYPIEILENDLKAVEEE